LIFEKEYGYAPISPDVIHSVIQDIWYDLWTVLGDRQRYFFQEYERRVRPSEIWQTRLYLFEGSPIFYDPEKHKVNDEDLYWMRVFAMISQIRLSKKKNILI